MNIGKTLGGRPALFLILAVLGGAIAMTLVFWPMLQRVRDLERQKLLMTEDINLVNGLMKTQNKNNLGPQLVTLNDAAKVMEEIVALGNTQAITFLSMARQDKNKSSYKKIDTLPVDLETQSTYKQLGLFMGALNDLLKGIVLVETFQIVRDGQAPDKVRSKMHIHICLKKEGHGKK